MRKILFLLFVFLLSSCASAPTYYANSESCNKSVDEMIMLNLKISQIDTFILHVINDSKVPLNNKTSTEQDFYLAMLVCEDVEVEKKLKEREQLVRKVLGIRQNVEKVCKHNH